MSKNGKDFSWLGLTKILIPVTLIIWAIYDVVTIYYGGVQTSISRVIGDLGTTYIQLSWAFFYVLGHLFWVQKIYYVEDRFGKFQRIESKDLRKLRK